MAITPKQSSLKISQIVALLVDLIALVVGEGQESVTQHGHGEKDFNCRGKVPRDDTIQSRIELVAFSGLRTVLCQVTACCNVEGVTCFCRLPIRKIMDVPTSRGTYSELFVGGRRDTYTWELLTLLHLLLQSKRRRSRLLRRLPAVTTGGFHEEHDRLAPEPGTRALWLLETPTDPLRDHDRLVQRPTCIRRQHRLGIESKLLLRFLFR